MLKQFAVIDILGQWWAQLYFFTDIFHVLVHFCDFVLSILWAKTCLQSSQLLLQVADVHCFTAEQQ